jgi:drug/metabolite transporter (DMT)-like permease
MVGEACALGAALTWSVSVILFKRSEAVSPQGLNLFKNVAGALLLTGTLLAMGQSIDWQRPAEDWWRLIASGVLGIALADTLIFMALRRLGAAALAVVDCAYAPTLVLLSLLTLGERVGASFVLGGALVVVGVLLATSRLRAAPVPSAVVPGAVVPSAGLPSAGLPSAGVPAEDGRPLGVLVGVSGIVAMAVGIVIAKPALERGALVEVTLVRLVAGVAGQLLWIAAVRSQRSALRALSPSRTWRTLLPASVLGSYLAMLFWIGGFKWAPASVAAVLNQLSTVFTIVLARVVLAEPLSKQRALGAALAVGGAVVVLLR